MIIHTLGFSPSLDVTYTLDVITAGAIHRPRTVLRLAGGKSLNASRAMVRLGRKVHAIVPLGGQLGELVAELLRPTGVILDQIDTSQPTRLCVSAADETAHTLTEFYEPAATGDESVVTAVAERLSGLGADDWLTISGNVPIGIDHDRLVEVLSVCTDRGVKLAVDVHGRALSMIIRHARPEVIKINRYEAAELVDDDHPDLVDLGRAVQSFGAADVVITDGAAGSIGLDRSGGGWRGQTER